MNNITKLNKKLCTGCGVCDNVCPVNAIHMMSDENGFLYPQVTEDCINCGLCIKKCPMLHNEKTNDINPNCYAIWGKEEFRQLGSSGGVFGILAKEVLKEQGMVVGAAFSKGCKTLRHICVYDEKDLHLLYKSKYVQSESDMVYLEVKKGLEEGRKVLFSGCPCQVDGLKKYLNKEYSNLITIDILCHGVPSPKAYKKFLEEINPQNKEIISVDFRDKKYGWGKLISVKFSDGTTYYDPHNGSYSRAFLSGLSMRESCLHCKYATVNRVGDITLGDFWGINQYKDDWNDKKGTSLVMCNTIRGEELIKSIQKYFKRIEEIPLNIVVDICKKANAALVRPTWYPKMRKCFFKHLNTDSFSRSLRYAEKSIMDIGILGWWIETPRSNYGSTLTCYALYQYLESLGYSVTFVSPPGFDRNNAGKFNLENEYRMTMKYSYEDMKENNKYIDTFIVGSDVLWYYDAFISSGYTFLLDFVNDDKRKISYSTSFGNTKRFFPESEMDKAKSLIQRFDYVAVREHEAVDICNEKFDVKAELVLDPVFLCDMYVWGNLAKKAVRTTEGNYLFAYLLDPTDEKVKEIKELAKERQLKIVSVTDKQFNSEIKQTILKDMGIIKQASIYEFIYHMMNASYIVTDSYHGLCFSIIFKKQFITLVNQSRGVSRFETLGKTLNITNRFSYDVDRLSKDLELSKDIDYSNINILLDKEIEKSKEWLQNAINGKLRKKNKNDIEICLNEIEKLKIKIRDLEAKLEDLSKNSNHIFKWIKGE